MKTDKKEIFKNIFVWSIFFGTVAYGVWVYFEYGVV